MRLHGLPLPLLVGLALLVVATPPFAAAAAGEAPAQRQAAREALAAGDAATAFARYRELARRGDAVGQNNLGVLLLRGEGVQADPEEAREWFSKAAAQGLPGAQYNHGLCLIRGLGGAVDEAAGLALLETAARAGDPDAHLELALRAVSEPAGRDQALAHFRVAAEAGRSLAQLDLANLLLASGDPAERGEAEGWLRRAAAGGEVLAAFNLGMLLLAAPEVQPESPGDGQAPAPADADASQGVEGLHWLRVAAAAGHPEALLNLGALEAEGRLVPQDIPAALTHWRLAAEQGEAAAQFNLGLAHARPGFGVEDGPEAYAWLALAASAGHAAAGRALDELSARLDGQQRKHGEQLFQQRIERFLRAPEEAGVAGGE